MATGYALKVLMNLHNGVQKHPAQKMQLGVITHSILV